jgi:membrane-associated protease RseP (regulator of RpoE activity)
VLLSETIGGVATPVIFGIVLVAFWSILFILKLVAKEKLERVGLDVNVPLLMWRTRMFNNLLDAIARRARDEWKIIGTLGFAVSLGLIVIAVRVMLMGFLPYFVTQIALYGPEPLKGIVTYLFPSQINQPTSPVTLFLPGVTVTLGSIFDWTLVAALLVVIVVHEGAHGVLARAEGITVKNSGLLLLLAIPGAFVEPDEEQMGKAKKVAQLRILAAGTSANFTVGLAVFLLLIANLGVYYASISPFYQPSAGVLVLGVVPNSAAANASVQVGQAITSIHNATVQYPVTDEASFQAALLRLRPGQSVTFDLLNITSGLTQSRILKMGTNPNANAAVKAFVGVTTFIYYPARFPSVLNSFVPATIYRLYDNIFLFSVGIAAVNMLPIWGLDGDRVVKILLQKVWGRHEKAAMYSLTTVRVLSISIIALAVITTFALHGQVSI